MMVDRLMTDGRTEGTSGAAGGADRTGRSSVTVRGRGVTSVMLKERGMRGRGCFFGRTGDYER